MKWLRHLKRRVRNLAHVFNSHRHLRAAVLPHCESGRGRDRRTPGGVSLSQGARIDRRVARADLRQGKAVRSPKVDDAPHARRQRIPALSITRPACPRGAEQRCNGRESRVAIDFPAYRALKPLAASEVSPKTAGWWKPLADKSGQRQIDLESKRKSAAQPRIDICHAWRMAGITQAPRTAAPPASGATVQQRGAGRGCRSGPPRSG